MQVLSRLMSPLVACRRPELTLESPESSAHASAKEIVTTRTPSAPGAWMACADVARQSPPRRWQMEPIADMLARAPRREGPDTCVVHHFPWKDPATASPDAVQAFYARCIAREGAFAGYLEAEVVGHLLGVRVGLWDQPYGRYYRWLATVGVDNEAAPTVHLVNLVQSHWSALIPPASPDALWVRVNAGGRGDCLFHALRAAVMAHPDLAEPPPTPELRRSCAEALAGGLQYQDRIVSLSAEAWEVWRRAPRWRRALLWVA